MSHALIIDDNMIVSRAIQDRLASLGFRSFDHTWTEEQAVAAAANHSPDLVVVGDSVESGSALNAARRITTRGNIPILMITADSGRMHQSVPRDARVEGPFLLTDMENAVALARTAG
ncbi:MAG: response regulator [Alphaproteobacteria bacterium]|nr:response regulator [Alphaproteobacteria bacterium]